MPYYDIAYFSIKHDVIMTSAHFMLHISILDVLFNFITRLFVKQETISMTKTACLFNKQYVIMVV